MERQFTFGTYRRLAYLSILAGMIFFLPYLVPVARTNSLSYVVGYNNHLALLIFTAGALLYAYLTYNDLPDEGVSDQRPLPLRALAIGLIVTAVACVGQRLVAPHPGLEAQYALNRLQMFAAGLRPYRDFEYAYGPLHLFVPLLISRLAHCSVVWG